VAPQREYEIVIAMPRALTGGAAAAAILLCGAAGVESCFSAGAGTQAGHVGNHTCLACHDGRSGPDKREWHDSPHGGIDCEDCHGPGLAHVRAGGRNGILIGNPGREPFAGLSRHCAGCHEDAVTSHQATLHFAAKGASCVDCHDVHKSGAMTFSTPNNTRLDMEGFNRLCGDCHQSQTEEFLLSGHALKQVADCGACHDAHAPRTLTAMPENNALCLQCHASSQLGFGNVETLDFHTGPFHPVDPDGSGASRCTSCHLPPQVRTGQRNGPHDHTLFTIPPITSNEAIAAGQTPSPNSCAGIMGCHDAAVPGTGMPYDLDNPLDNTALQQYFEQIGGLPQ
jgi:predicted CXXCH cytochrome family protein